MHKPLKHFLSGKPYCTQVASDEILAIDIISVLAFQTLERPTSLQLSNILLQYIYQDDPIFLA